MTGIKQNFHFQALLNPNRQSKLEHNRGMIGIKDAHRALSHFISWVKSDGAGYAIREEITLA